MYSQTEIDKVVAKYVGIPYRHDGRDKGGLDCLGVIYCVLSDFSIEIPDGDGREICQEWYQEEPGRFLKGLVEVGEEAKLPLQPLDIVYFEMIDNVVTHGGVMVDESRFIHILEGRTVSITRLKGFWASKLAGARRLIKWLEQ